MKIPLHIPWLAVPAAQTIDNRAPAETGVERIERLHSGDGETESDDSAPLSIPEAKRRLAATFGVPKTAIKINIEH